MSQERKLIATDAGVDVQVVYEKIYDKETNRFKIVEKERFSISEKIQKSSNLSDLATLKVRYAQLGEIPDLPARGVNGIDTSIIPSNIHELQRQINSVNATYSKLDPELRKAFGGLNGYVDSITKGTAQKILVDYYKAKAKKPEKVEEVKE